MTAQWLWRNHQMTTIDEAELYWSAQRFAEAIVTRSGLPDKAKYPIY